MTLTVATVDIVGEDDTVLANPYGMAHLSRRLVFAGDGLDGTGRTDLRAACALGAAVATLIGELGLHEAVEAGGGTQHAIRTSRHAELASGAVLGKVLGCEGTRGKDGCLTLGDLLVEDLGQAAVDLLLLGLKGSGSCHCGCSGEEGTT
jgi:hypothetical protein